LLVPSTSADADWVGFLTKLATSQTATHLALTPHADDPADAAHAADPTKPEDPDDATPPDPVPTADARAALPAEVPLSDAVHNIAYAALLTLGLAKDDFSLIARGLSDRLHQDRRAHLYPRSMELIACARELGAIGATISGAGPSVLFWCHWEQTGTLMEALWTEAADCIVRRVQFAPGGAEVEALE